MLNADPVNLGWSVRVIRCATDPTPRPSLIHPSSPQAISRGMLKVPPTNLNKQSQDATIQLIRDVLQCGVQLSDVTVFPPTAPPKLTHRIGVRRCARQHLVLRGTPVLRLPGHQLHSDHQSGLEIQDRRCGECRCQSHPRRLHRGLVLRRARRRRPNRERIWKGLWERVSFRFANSLPSIQSKKLAPHLDPKTKAWIEESLEKTFGYPSVARFSWTTVKVALEKSAHPVKWCVSLLRRSCFSDFIGYRIDEGQDALVMAFSSAQGRDKDRNLVTRDLCLRSVGTL